MAGLAVLFFVLCLGDNRWRVRYQHDVRVPASARDLRCAGCTAFPMNIVDGDSWAWFTINGADLPPLLS